MFGRTKQIRLCLMLSQNLDCELNLTGEMNRIFMKTPTRRASPAARSDHAFQSVSQSDLSQMLAARRTGGTLIDYNIRLVSPLPTGVRPTDGRRACETVKRKRRPVGVCRRDANSTSRQTGRGRRARAAAATSYFQFIDRTRAAGRLNGHKFIEDLPCTGVEPYK